MYAHELKRTLRPGMIGEILRVGALATGLGFLAANALRGQESQVPYDYDAAGPGAELDGSYGYVRTLEGSATLVPLDGDRTEIQVNEPLLVGDRLFISGDSRAEVILADRNLLRLGDAADLGFRALAYSADSADPATVLDLRRGTLQVIVSRDQLGRDLPTVVTPNSSVLFREAGTYLIVVDDGGYTEVVVRSGVAEVRSEADAAEVRRGESLFVEGARGTAMQFADAPGLDRLEAWGNRLGDYASGDYGGGYVADNLGYEASTLNDYGSWVSVGSSRAWRPYVSSGWAPYRHGRWRYTPTGWFWVSHDPWGWVPHHYGYWDHHHSYGWVWYPGRRFASAHVYLYWGSGGYAGWIPTGYYDRHYGHHYGSRFGFHFGVYGYLGGSSWYAKNRYWTFLPTHRLGHRRQHIYALSGYDLGRRGHALGRGVLLTDTRQLRPDVWRRPGEGLARLTRQAERNGRRLGDATAFAERVERLPASLERVTLRDRAGNGRGGVASRAGAVSRGGAATRGGAVSRDAGGTARPNRANVETRRPAVGRGNSTGRAIRPEARGRAAGSSPTARPTARSDRGAARGGGTLRRPETSRPSARRPAVDRGSQRSGASPQRPEVRSRASDRGGLRRPAVRSSGAERTRPTVRSSGSSRQRPTARSSDSSRQRPTARSSGSSRQRPTARSSGSSRQRPTARSSGSSRQRPTARSSGSSRQRPTARSSGSSRSRPTARSSGSSRSRPTARSSGSSRSRPTARSSGSSRSRPSARSSGSSRSRPSASRSSGASRSGSASPSSGRSGRSGSSRSRRGGGPDA